MIELCNFFVARLGYAPWEKYGENRRLGKLSFAYHKRSVARP